MIQSILANEWYEAGVKDGDIVLLHSNITRTLIRFMKQRIEISPQDILESFLKVVGKSGTLLLPLYNFDFTKGIPFDIRYTPSHMGALTEAGRLHPLAVRTGHPIYSFAAIGKHAEKFKYVNNFSGYGNNSPFAILREMDGKIAVLNLPDQNSMTFYHHIEEMNDVSYRYHKTFTGEYTDERGVTEPRTYGLFVRNIDIGVLTHVNPAGELMWDKGLYSGCRYNDGCGLRTVSSQKMYEFISEIITSGKAQDILYRVNR